MTVEPSMVKVSSYVLGWTAMVASTGVWATALPERLAVTDPSPEAIDKKPGEALPAGAVQAFGNKVDMMDHLCGPAGFGDLKQNMNFGGGAYAPGAIGIRNYKQQQLKTKKNVETKAIHDHDTLGLVPQHSTGCADTAVSIAHEWRHIQRARAANTEKDESREPRSVPGLGESMERRRNNVEDACTDLTVLCKIAAASGDAYPKSDGSSGEVPSVSCKELQAAEDNLKAMGDDFNDLLEDVKGLGEAEDVESWTAADCPDIASDDCPCEDEDSTEDGGDDGGGQ